MKQSCNEPLMLDFIRDVHYSEAYYLPAREAIKKHFPELFQIPKEKVKKRFVRKQKWIQMIKASTLNVLKVLAFSVYSEYIIFRLMVL